MKNTLPHYTQDSFLNYIGLPYETYDCYEIIQKFYKEVMGRDLESLYVARPTRSETQDILEDEKQRFLEVTTPRCGDIIVFRVLGLSSHVGMYVNNDVFFHSRKSTNSCLEKLSVWKKRVVGYYRWP